MTVTLDPVMQNHCPPWEPQQLPANKTGTKECRSKMTVPKPVEVSEEESVASSDMEEEMEQEPVQGPPLKQSPVARQVVRPRLYGGRRRNGSIQDHRAYEEDYRRFSERSRKKTDFFGISHKEEEEEKQSQRGRSRGPGTGRKGKRVLDLGRKLHLLDEKLAGSPEEVMVQGKEDGRNEEALQATDVVSYNC